MTPLTSIARRAHPLNRRHAAKFVLAARWLRAQGKWIVDPGTPKPSWANKEQPQ